MPIVLVGFVETDRKRLDLLLNILEIKSHIEHDRIFISEDPDGGHLVSTHMTPGQLDGLTKEGFTPKFVRKDLPDPRKYVSKENRFKAELDRLLEQKGDG